ncbi:MAG: DUF1987 domain-containing protein [Xanthomonadales bacterium]|nr:hypothetical protein [Xanthomonadales bacterium]MCC6591824.1 DUF1987 domain-containing protein [Xanthomonadales bacterium]MCE7931444.1 DUF1987 domain-containing protein [Xanthomonadales bacterium PRO6]
MTDLKISGSTSTPSIECTLHPTRVHMKGDSYPENAFELYQPVLQWMEAQLASAGELTMDLELVYLNTSSVRIMMDLFDTLEEAHKRGCRVAVHWYYDVRNERVAELAGEFREDLTLPFHIQPQG